MRYEAQDPLKAPTNRTLSTAGTLYMAYHCGETGGPRAASESAEVAFDGAILARKAANSLTISSPWAKPTGLDSLVRRHRGIIARAG